MAKELRPRNRLRERGNATRRRNGARSHRSHEAEPLSARPSEFATVVENSRSTRLRLRPPTRSVRAPAFDESRRKRARLRGRALTCVQACRRLATRSKLCRRGSMWHSEARPRHPTPGILRWITPTRECRPRRGKAGRCDRSPRRSVGQARFAATSEGYRSAYEDIRRRPDAWRDLTTAARSSHARCRPARGHRTIVDGGYSHRYSIETPTLVSAIDAS